MMCRQWTHARNSALSPPVTSFPKRQHKTHTHTHIYTIRDVFQSLLQITHQHKKIKSHARVRALRQRACEDWGSHFERESVPENGCLETEGESSRRPLGCAVQPPASRGQYMQRHVLAWAGLRVRPTWLVTLAVANETHRVGYHVLWNSKAHSLKRSENCNMA